MADEASNDLISLTAEIVSAHVANNPVQTGDIGSLIASVHQALAGLGVAEEPPAPAKPKGAVSARASIKPGHLVSMIDGEPYKMLRRHIAQHGYTPESYRETFGLSRDYPMVAADYAEQRRTLAHKIGLGRKAAAPEAEAAEPDAPEPTPLAKRQGKPKTGTPASTSEPAPARRARKAKAQPAADDEQ